MPRPPARSTTRAWRPSARSATRGASPARSPTWAAWRASRVTSRPPTTSTARVWRSFRAWDIGGASPACSESWRYRQPHKARRGGRCGWRAPRPRCARRSARRRPGRSRRGSSAACSRRAPASAPSRATRRGTKAVRCRTTGPWTSRSSRIRPRPSLRAGRIDHAADRRDAVGGEPAPPRVLEDRILAFGDVDAVELVAGHVAVEPLDLGAHVAQHVARLLGYVLDLRGAEVPEAGYIPLDHELGHDVLLFAAWVMVTAGALRSVWSTTQ